MSNSETSDQPVAPMQNKTIFDWLWRPMHAKIWWTMMSLYWSSMFVSIHLGPLSDFYSSAIAVFLNVFFFPPLMLLVLLFGYFEDRLGRIDFDGAPEGDLGVEWQGDAYGPSGMLREFDPHDPASGSNWIGSPLNPTHPFYVIRHRHSS